MDGDNYEWGGGREIRRKEMGAPVRKRNQCLDEMRCGWGWGVIIIKIII